MKNDKHIQDQLHIELPPTPFEPTGNRPSWHQEDEAPRGVNISDIGGNDVGDSGGMTVLYM